MNTQNKYRPKCINEYIFESQDLKEVVEMYALGHTIRPLILHGGHGTGKSLLAELIPKSIDGPNVVVQRLTVDDLKTHKSINDKLVRTAVFDSLTEQEGQTGYYTVFDECKFDSKVLTDRVRLALDKMEDRGLYIFVTNDLATIDSGVISRSTCMHVPPLSPDSFLPRAMQILQSEGVTGPSDIVLEALKASHKVSPDNRRYYEALDRLIYRANHH